MATGTVSKTARGDTRRGSTPRPSATLSLRSMTTTSTELVPDWQDSGYRRSPADHRDWDYRRAASVNALSSLRLPRRFEVDRRSPIRPYDQGQLPSCAGWMAAMLKTVQERKDLRRTVRFDGLELYQQVALPGGGAYLRDILRVARDVGVLATTGIDAGNRHKVASWAAVNPRDHQAVKHAIVRSRGVIIGFGVTRRWAAGGGQEFRPPGGQDPDQVIGGHGMFSSGYDDSIGPLGLNSWGPRWRDLGRAHLDWAYWDKHVWECWAVLDVDDPPRR